jgi:hypothetical protein
MVRMGDFDCSRRYWRVAVPTAVNELTPSAARSGYGERMDRTDTEFAQVWEQFHALVNMSSPELRDWLLNTPEGVDTYAPEPDIDIHSLGLRVLQVKEKRRMDLTNADLDMMREVTDLISSRLRGAPEADVNDQPWRDTLMTLGHDPTRSDSPRGADL